MDNMFNDFNLENLNLKELAILLDVLNNIKIDSINKKNEVEVI